MNRLEEFDWLIGLDEENRKDGWPYRFAIILALCFSLYFYGYGYTFLLKADPVQPQLNLPIELQNQLWINQKEYNEHKAGMLKAEASNKEILEEVLMLNNIAKQPNEQWFLTSDGKQWKLFKKNKW